MYLLLFIIIAALIGFVFNLSSNTKRLKELKSNYYRLLQGTDRRAALAAGRAYYGALRKDKALTIYDEQAITNDLSTMGQAPLLPNS